MINKEYKRFYLMAAVVLIFATLIISTIINQKEGTLKSMTNIEDDIFGCYEYQDCQYIHPLSSFFPSGHSMPYVYGIENDSLIIANTRSGEIEQFSAQYGKTPVDTSEFTVISDFEPKLFPATPDLSQYEERWLRAELIGDASQQSRLYQMDDEIWLVNMANGKLWSIYRLQKTDKTKLADLKRALKMKNTIPEGLVQMTIKDVYYLARKRANLTYQDFEGFYGKAAGSGFMSMRYDIAGGCVLIVHQDTPDSSINYARMSKRGYDPFNEDLTVDIRLGTGAVAAYLNPLHSLSRIKIEDSHDGFLPRELIYEFDGYRYYLNTTRAERVYVTFDNGERLPLKQALEERRLIIEDAVANGLFNVFMEPVDNPMGGQFPILHHRHKFAFDDEGFYPSSSFMYVIYNDNFFAYYDRDELADILVLQGREEIARKLCLITNTDNLADIGSKVYISEAGLTEAGISVKIGWELSSHTPVYFTSISD